MSGGGGGMDLGGDRGRGEVLRGGQVKRRGIYRREGAWGAWQVIS